MSEASASFVLKAGTVAPSVMLKKLSGYKQQNRLHLALQEIGRIERTLFTMDWSRDRTFALCPS